MRLYAVLMRHHQCHYITDDSFGLLCFIVYEVHCIWNKLRFSDTDEHAYNVPKLVSSCHWCMFLDRGTYAQFPHPSGGTE